MITSIALIPCYLEYNSDLIQLGFILTVTHDNYACCYQWQIMLNGINVYTISMNVSSRGLCSCVKAGGHLLDASITYIPP
jgi:hypothetical protein